MLQNATVKGIQAEEQFPYRKRLGDGAIQLLVGEHALQRGAIDKLQRPRALMGEKAGCPILAAAECVGHLANRRSATQALSELSLQPVGGT